MSKVLATVLVDIELSNISDYYLISELLRRKRLPERSHITKTKLIALLDILDLKVEEIETGIMVKIENTKNITGE